MDLYPISGLQYYRLLQTDEDGIFTYSKIISVVWNKTEALLSVYPNPSSGLITVEWGSTLPIGTVDIHIYDILGNLVFTANKSTVEPHTIDISALKGGIYFFQLYRNNVPEHVVKITKI